jgi:hypothetical protein
MLICPVDLGACERAACRYGVCAMSDAPILIVCWQCGTVESSRVVHGICIECLRVPATANAEE